MSTRDLANISSFSFSYPSGEPPTPLRTPTSATFAQSSFETPKAETSFYDPRVTWSTTDPWATSPDVIKATRSLVYKTPTKSPIISRDLKRPLSGQDLQAELASHVHHLSPNPSLSLPPVEPARQLSSSPNPTSTSAAKRVCQRTPETTLTLNTALEEDTRLAMRSAGSMQTPPPTSTSASRRKAQQAQVAKLVRSPGAGGRRMSSPNTAKKVTIDIMSAEVEASPNLFPGLQFSPDVFGDFSMAGPATAPVYPQHKLFWDPDQNTNDMNIDFPTDNAFALGTGIHKTLDPFVSNYEQTSITHDPSVSSFHRVSTNDGDIMGLSLSASTVTVNQSAFLSASSHLSKGSSQSKTHGNAVDPSLLFSSPGRLAEHADIPSLQPDRSENLQPYAHQLRDAQIEREIKATRKPKRRRGPELDSPAVKAALQTLRDEKDSQLGITENSLNNIVVASTTEGRTRKARTPLGLSESHLHRSYSPGKQRKPSQLNPQINARQSRKTSAVTLTIDANGRAKTETRGSIDKVGLEHGMDVDNVSERSESDSSSDDARMIMSQPQYFGFPAPKQQQPKLGRFATDSKTHSQRSSDTSTFASRHNAPSLPVSEAPKRQVTSNLSSITHSRNPSYAHEFIHAPSPTTISDAMNGEMESEVETVRDSDDGKGDAQSELKKIIENKVRKQANGRPWGSRLKKHSMAQQGQIHPAFGSRVHPHTSYQGLAPNSGRGQETYSNISPTTITDPDLATPSTGRDSQRGESTRCVCHITDADDQLMILW